MKNRSIMFQGVSIGCAKDRSRLYDKGDWELFTSYKNYLSFPLSYGGGRLTLSSGVIVLGFVRRFGVI